MKRKLSPNTPFGNLSPFRNNSNNSNFNPGESSNDEGTNNDIPKELSIWNERSMKNKIKNKMMGRTLTKYGVLTNFEEKTNAKLRLEIQPNENDSIATGEKSFDVIYYVNTHGMDDDRANMNFIDILHNTIGIQYTKVPKTCSVSLLSSGEYGSLSQRGVHTPDDFKRIVSDMMTDCNNDKTCIFKALAKRLNKERALEVHGKNNNRQSKAIWQTNRWTTVMNLTSYFQTHYIADKTFDGIYAIWKKTPNTATDPNFIKVAGFNPNIQNNDNNVREQMDNKLCRSGLIKYARSQGYKNIGIIEHTCNEIFHYKNVTARSITAQHKKDQYMLHYLTMVHNINHLPLADKYKKLYHHITRYNQLSINEITQLLDMLQENIDKMNGYDTQGPDYEAQTYEVEKELDNIETKCVELIQIHLATQSKKSKTINTRPRIKGIKLKGTKKGQTKGQTRNKKGQTRNKKGHKK